MINDVIKTVIQTISVFQMLQLETFSEEEWNKKLNYKIKNKDHSKSQCLQDYKKIHSSRSRF